jgi:hypothetical protein
LFDPARIQGDKKVMVWCGLFGDNVIGPFFFDENVNGDNYKKLLEDEVLPALTLCDTYPEMFQHDGAPAHFSNEVTRFLNDQFPAGWIGRGGPINWPARSPDLNPLDFYLWGHLKAMVYTERVNTIDELKDRILNCALLVTPRILRRVQQNFVKRMGKCIAEGGNHIEHLL